jgi:hypothetical protein
VADGSSVKVDEGDGALILHNDAPAAVG